MRKQHWAILMVLLILIVDQATKILVKTNMHLEEMIPVIGALRHDEDTHVADDYRSGRHTDQLS